MGTRSTTKIYEDGKLLLALYKQYDGYPEGWGKELKAFLKSGIFVNGISLSKEEGNKRMFNGGGDFALQLVKEFKIEAGGLYATNKDDTQEYNYRIDINHNKETYKYKEIVISCEEDKKFKEVLKNYE